MEERADALDLKPMAGNGVRVQISPGACKSDRKEVRTMLEIKGKINTAICYASVIEEEAIEQIRRMCDYEFTGCPCRKGLYDRNDHDCRG